MMKKLYAFLARAPALQGLTVQVGDVGPAPGTAARRPPWRRLASAFTAVSAALPMQPCWPC